MVESIVAFWRDCNGPIHPADEHVLSAAPNVFNLDFPPPAFVGEVNRAQVIILNGNGGYKPDITPFEFPNDVAVSRYLDRLHHPRKVDFAEAADYYRNVNYAPWLATGQIAMVNAIAYRAPKITNQVREIATKLESVRIHNHWLHNELLPAARAGRRLVIAHRYGLWRLDRNTVQTNLHFTDAQVSPHLPNKILALVNEFLAAVS